MEPTKFETRSELPEPMADNSPNLDVSSMPETLPSQNSAPQVTPINNQARVQTAPPTPISQPAVGSDGSLSSQVSSALIADDADLIEKEWVLKAKAIVAQTAHDPNSQTKEVVKIKAEYLKKRYNKQLKQDEN